MFTSKNGSESLHVECTAKYIDKYVKYVDKYYVL